MNSLSHYAKQLIGALCYASLSVSLFSPVALAQKTDTTEPPSKPAQPEQQQPPILSIEQRAKEAGVPLDNRVGRRRTRLDVAAEREARKWRLEQAKRNAAKLAELANALNADVANTDEKVLPVGIVERAAKIESLAKQIKNWGKGR